MWDNNDGDYDHVDAGNQERNELGKKIFRYRLRSTFANSHLFVCFKHNELFQLSTLKVIQFWNIYTSLNMNF